MPFFPERYYFVAAPIRSTKHRSTVAKTLLLALARTGVADILFLVSAASLLAAVGFFPALVLGVSLEAGDRQPKTRQ